MEDERTPLDRRPGVNFETVKIPKITRGPNGTKQPNPFEGQVKEIKGTENARSFTAAIPKDKTYKQLLSKMRRQLTEAGNNHEVTVRMLPNPEGEPQLNDDGTVTVTFWTIPLIVHGSSEATSTDNKEATNDKHEQKVNARA